MQRNERTTLGRLKDGDRFYLMSDKQKIIWTMVPLPKNRTMDTRFCHWAQKDGMRWANSFQGSTKVVFLRHA
jgi:hypothetical protein